LFIAGRHRRRFLLFAPFLLKKSDQKRAPRLAPDCFFHFLAQGFFL
jgi:hypothetical protein